jgi:hypothetical protein
MHPFIAAFIMPSHLESTNLLNSFYWPLADTLGSQVQNFFPMLSAN